MSEEPKRPLPRPHVWFERITWTLIYAGLLTVVYSFALDDQAIHTVWGWSVRLIGAAVTAGGLLMIYIRSTFKD